MRTQRFERSSRTPGLRFPPLKSAAMAMARVAMIRAIRAGWEKNAANPPHPRMPRPR